MKAKMRRGCLIIAALMLLSTAVCRGDDTTTNPMEPQMAEKGLVWEDFGIGGGGYITFITIDPTDPNNIYIGTDCGGLYKTSDRGRHWRHICRAITAITSNRQIEDLIVDPRGNGVVYASCAPHMFRSDDKGENWKLLKNMPMSSTASRYACLAFDPENPDVIYAGQGCVTLHDGYPKGLIVRSRDRGETWESLTNGINPKASFHSICIDPFSPKENRIIYTCSNIGIYRSTDNGKTWNLHNGNLPFTSLGQLALFADRKEKRRVFYLTSARKWVEEADKVKRLRGGVFRSDDDGQTWREINAGLPQDDNLQPKCITISRKSPDTAWVGVCPPANGAYGTTDGGKTWQPLTRMGENMKVKGLAIQMLKGGWGLNISGVAVDPSDERRLYETDNDIYESTDGGKTWETISSDEIRPGWFKSRGTQQTFFDCIAISPHRPDVMLVGDDDLNLLKSEDGGVSWAPRWAGSRPGDEFYEMRSKFAGGSQCAGCIVFDPDVQGIVYASGSTYDLNRVIAGRYPLSKGWCMKSVDFGNNWTAITPDNGLPLGLVWGNAIAVDRKSPKDKRTVYAAVYGGGIYRSDDSGMKWYPVNTGLPEGLRTTCVAVHPQDSNILYAGVCPRKGDTALGGVFKSLDAGKTWTKVSGNPEIPGVYTMTVNPRNGNQIYAVNIRHTDPETAKKYAAGLYQSDDGGKTWIFRIRMNAMKTVAVNPLFPEIAYAVADPFPGGGNPLQEMGGVFRTMDGGKTWKNINGDLERVPLCPTTIALRPDDPSVIFIGLQGPGGYKAVDHEAREYMKKHQDKNVLLNGSFEELDADGTPSGWEMHAPVINGKKILTTAADDPADGKRVLKLDLTRITPEDLKTAPKDTGVYLTQKLTEEQMARLRGKTVRFNARLKFEKTPERLAHMPTFCMDIWRGGGSSLLFETVIRRFMGKESTQPFPIMINEIYPEQVDAAKLGRYQDVSLKAMVGADIDQAVLVAWLVEKVNPDTLNLRMTIDDLRLTVE